MYTSKEVQDVADVLHRIAHTPYSKLEHGTGICGNILRISSEQHLKVFQYYCIEAYQKWPKYSEDMHYPINGDAAEPPFSVFHRAKENKSMWVGDYGRLRCELLVHLCTYFQDRAYKMRLNESVKAMCNPFPTGRIPVRDESPLTRVFFS